MLHSSLVPSNNAADRHESVDWAYVSCELQVVDDQGQRRVFQIPHTAVSPVLFLGESFNIGKRLETAMSCADQVEAKTAEGDHGRI